MAATLNDAAFRKHWNILYDKIRAWEQADGPTINGRKAISLELQQAIEAAVNATADFDRIGAERTIEKDGYEWVVLFDYLAKSYRDYKVSVIGALAEEDIESDGSVSMWRAIAALKDYANLTYHYPLPQPVNDLRLAGVSDHQIAAIYGWTDEAGNADFLKVSEEAAKPGTHYNPKTWEHPGKRGRYKLAEESMDGREKRSFEYTDEEEQLSFQVTMPPSIEELLNLDAPPEQIARLHNMSVDQATSLVAASKIAAKKGSRDQIEMQSKIAKAQVDANAAAKKQEGAAS